MCNKTISVWPKLWSSFLSSKSILLKNSENVSSKFLMRWSLSFHHIRQWRCRMKLDKHSTTSWTLLLAKLVICKATFFKVLRSFTTRTWTKHSRFFGLTLCQSKTGNWQRWFLRSSIEKKTIASDKHYHWILCFRITISVALVEVTSPKASSIWSVKSIHTRSSILSALNSKTILRF